MSSPENGDPSTLYEYALGYGWARPTATKVLAIAIAATYINEGGNTGVEDGTVFGIPTTWLNKHGWYADDPHTYNDDFKMLKLATNNMTNFSLLWVAYRNPGGVHLGQTKLPRFQAKSAADDAMAEASKISQVATAGGWKGEEIANHGWSNLQQFVGPWSRNQYSRQTNLSDKARRQRR
jgi:hypothetical protein